MASASVFLIFFVLGASSAGNVTLRGGKLLKSITFPVALGDVLIDILTGKILIKFRSQFTSDGTLGQTEVAQNTNMFKPNVCVVDIPFFDVGTNTDTSVSVNGPVTANPESGYLGINISMTCGCLMPIAGDSDEQYQIATLGLSTDGSVWYIYNGNVDIAPGRTFQFISDSSPTLRSVKIASCKKVKLTREDTTEFAIFTFTNNP